MRVTPKFDKSSKKPQWEKITGPQDLNKAAKFEGQIVALETNADAYSKHAWSPNGSTLFAYVRGNDSLWNPTPGALLQIVLNPPAAMPCISTGRGLEKGESLKMRAATKAEINDIKEAVVSLKADMGYGNSEGNAKFARALGLDAPTVHNKEYKKLLQNLNRR